MLIIIGHAWTRNRFQLNAREREIEKQWPLQDIIWGRGHFKRAGFIGGDRRILENLRK